MAKDLLSRPRLTMVQKEANHKQWYREHIDRLDHHNTTDPFLASLDYQITDQQRMKVNYALFNNKINLEDFAYVCRPFGAEAGELPAQMVNRDIVSEKVKALLGMELRLPFSWKAFAVNAEATTRKEQKKFSLIRDYVIEQVLASINQEQPVQTPQEQAPQQMLQAQPQQQQAPVGQIQQPQQEEQGHAMTPPEVMRYMEREHQDPAEVLANQLLAYLAERCELKAKFSQGFKHYCLSAREIYLIEIWNKEPNIEVVNPLHFRCSMSANSDKIEDGEWATCEYMMSPSEVVNKFGEYLTDSDIDKIYDKQFATGTQEAIDEFFEFDDDITERDLNTVRVLHCTWKGLRKIQFLTYSNEEGEILETIVDENYKLNEDAGDINLESQWIPEVYEGWKIGTDIYVKMQPVPGQFKDIDNLFYCKLPYYGVVCDNMNSEPVSIMDRLKTYQYYYNIVMYRLELMLASDKGKKILMNINAIPKSSGIDIKKWQYFFESTSIMWIDPNEEGSGYNDVNTLAKTIDLSLASDISRYIQLADYIRQQAGVAVGINEKITGEVGNRETSTNYQQSLQQSSNTLEPYFFQHTQARKAVIEALLEQAKIAYSTYHQEKLVYVTDDLTQKIIEMDDELLDNSTYGIFVTDSYKLEETKQQIQQLAQAALQSQQIELADVISVLRQQTIVEAEEVLKVRQKQKLEEVKKMQEQEQQALAQEEEKKREFERERHQMELETIRVKEAERRQTEIIKASLTGASFNPDLDKDNDGTNDFMELAKAADHNLKVEQVQAKNQLDREKFENQKQVEAKKIAIEKEKLALQKQKLQNERNKKEQ